MQAVGARCSHRPLVDAVERRIPNRITWGPYRSGKGLILGGVTSPADAIPDLERLMRDVLRSVFDTTLGAEWLKRLSNQVRQAVEQTAEIARKQRPNETLRDDWAAVGIGEIAATLRSTWPTLNGALAGVWLSPDEATVDLSRLVAYRGKNLHAVGPPQGQIKDEEVAAMILRLRIGFEGLRRSLAHDDGKWWPYIEAIHSNIPEFCFDQTTRPHCGNPSSSPRGIWSDSRLSVSILRPPRTAFGTSSRVAMRFPRHLSARAGSNTPSSVFRCQENAMLISSYIADVDDPKNPDMRSFRCNVRPR